MLTATIMSSGAMASIYSQPANTGAGAHVRTQLVTALHALRVRGFPSALVSPCEHADLFDHRANATPSR